jgi:hypothetical protein
MGGLGKSPPRVKLGKPDEAGEGTPAAPISGTQDPAPAAPGTAPTPCAELVCDGICVSTACAELPAPAAPGTAPTPGAELVCDGICVSTACAELVCDVLGEGGDRNTGADDNDAGVITEPTEAHGEDDDAEAGAGRFAREGEVYWLSECDVTLLPPACSAAPPLRPGSRRGNTATAVWVTQTSRR